VVVERAVEEERAKEERAKEARAVGAKIVVARAAASIIIAATARLRPTVAGLLWTGPTRLMVAACVLPRKSSCGDSRVRVRDTSASGS
jgi:hypothetical protein